MSTRKPDRPDPACTEVREGIYTRWSRRKQRARESGQADGEPLRGAEDVTSVEATAADAVSPPPLTDADMPPLESLDESSDFSGFMSPGVSEELRSKALRKLFLSSQFNVLDGLDDYDDDFTAFDALGDLITSDMRYQQELAEQRAREAAEREGTSGTRTAPRDDAPPTGDALTEVAQATQPLDHTPASEAAARSAPGACADDNDAVPGDAAARSGEDDEHAGDGGIERA